MSFIESVLLDSTVSQYSLAITWSLTVFFLLKLLKYILLHYIQGIAKRIPGNSYFQVFFTITSRISFLFYVALSVWSGTQLITVTPLLHVILRWFVVVVLTWEVVKAIKGLIQYFADNYAERHNLEDESADMTVVQTIVLVANIAAWVIALLMLLSNMGYNVNTIVASLGIGGIAVALAVQNVLADLVSSLSLFFDRPFQVGDYITVGTSSGKVEKFGLKTTRLRTLQGQLLIIPNSDLMKSRIENHHRMEKRRVDFSLGVAYNTPNEKLKKIPHMLEKIIEGYDNTQYQHCYFKAFGNPSLVFEVAYMITTRQFDVYIQTHHEINLAIKAAFKKSGITLTQPS